jgi:hypothetical protein
MVPQSSATGLAISTKVVQRMILLPMSQASLHVMTRTNYTVGQGAHTSNQHTTKKMTALSVWLSDAMVLVVVDDPIFVQLSTASKKLLSLAFHVDLPLQPHGSLVEASLFNRTSEVVVSSRRFF